MKRLEWEVEGLRGLAAVMVLYTHLCPPVHHVDPGYAPPAAWYLFEAGQGAVLLFFVLSGYVIGMTNQESFSPSSAKNYLLRRFVRLVPLCWLAILLSVLVYPIDPWGTVLGNLFFLQNNQPYGTLSLPLLVSNTNLWSLNYEALYYLLFVGLWAFRTGPKIPLIIAAAVMFSGLYLPASPVVLTNYAAGWVFWLAGFSLSSAAKSTEAEVRWPWPSLLLFGLATWKVKPLFQTAKRIGISMPQAESWVNFTYIDFLPVCIALLMVVGQRRPRFGSLLVWISAGVPIAYLGWRIIRGRFAADDLAVYDWMVLTGIALWWWRPSLWFFRYAAPLGAISYGIYIFQRPAQWFVAYSDWLPSGNVISYSLRAAIILTLTFALAWLAEIVLQPRIRKLVLPQR